LGRSPRSKGDSEGAIRYFNQALSINPKFAAAYLGRGVARYQLLDRAGAIRDAKLAENSLAQANIGVIKQRRPSKELQSPTASTPKSKPNFMNFSRAQLSFAVVFVLTAVLRTENEYILHASIFFFDCFQRIMASESRPSASLPGTSLCTRHCRWYTSQEKFAYYVGQDASWKLSPVHTALRQRKLLTVRDLYLPCPNWRGVRRNPSP